MRRRHRLICLLLLVGLVPLAGARASLQASKAPPLLTGVVDYPSTDSSDSAVALRRMRQLGASFVGLPLDWRDVAPKGTAKPAGFDAKDPEDPHYHWAEVDRQVTAAVRAGLTPMLTVDEAPTWAAPTPRNRGQDGPTRPDPDDFGDFATAAARRYSGKTLGLPRVRYWQAWNEPNVSIYLMPQYEDGKVVSVEWFRKLVNAFSDAAHAVDTSNVVIAGGLSPFTVKNAAVETVGPLRFLRLLFCVSAGAHPRATCSGRVRADAIAIHPYTSGDPYHSAENDDDISLGDLPKLHAVVTAAVRLGHLVSRRPVETWITEFSWDSKPPDRLGVPMQLETRWVAEAQYVSWRNGVDHFFWFTIRDQPRATSDFQAGLYFRGDTIGADRQKPLAAAFRFPFVAYTSGSRTNVWGRTPSGGPGSVRVQLTTGSGWRAVASLRAGANGIFAGTLPVGPRVGRMRASSGGVDSPSFSLTRPPDYPVTPFGATS